MGSFLIPTTTGRLLTTSILKEHQGMVRVENYWPRLTTYETQQRLTNLNIT